jgi:hypothetical protein
MSAKRIQNTGDRSLPRSKRGQKAGLVFPVGQRVAVKIPGHAIDSEVFLKLGDRGVVTHADPTGDIVTINFEFRRVPGGLRVPVTHLEKINHDVQPVVND